MGASGEALLACPLLTSYCGAWFLIGSRPLLVHSPGLKTPMLEERKLCWVNIKKCRHGAAHEDSDAKAGRQEAGVEQRQVGTQQWRPWR